MNDVASSDDLKRSKFKWRLYSLATAAAFFLAAYLSYTHIPRYSYDTPPLYVLLPLIFVATGIMEIIFAFLSEPMGPFAWFWYCAENTLPDPRELQANEGFSWIGVLLAVMGGIVAFIIGWLVLTNIQVQVTNHWGGCSNPANMSKVCEDLRKIASYFSKIAS